MFDRRSLFNKIRFDREVIEDPLKKFRIFSSGSIEVTPEFYTPVTTDADVGSEGGMEVVPLFITPISDPELESEGNLEVPEFTLVLELEIRMGGDSDFDVYPVGDLDVSVIDLRNIELGPLDTLTIDTDLMIVLFGTVHDVSSLTIDSEFFWLGVGDNKLIFDWDYEDETPPDPLPDEELEISVIYENRYL